MRELYDLLRREVQRYGGMIQPVAGDRFLALFGLPVARKITLDAPCWQPSECSSGCRHEQTVWLDQQGSV